MIRWDRLERWVLVALFLVLAAKVGVDSGLPAVWLDATRALAAIVVLIACLRRRTLRRWLDLPRAMLILVALWYLPQVYARVGGDGVEYFVQARSMLFDRDLDFANDYAGLGRAPVISINDTIVSRPPVGVALLWIPAMLLAHAFAHLAVLFGASLATDGFSVLYTSSVTAAAYLYGWLAAFVVEAIVRQRWGRSIGFLVSLGLVLASPLVFYMTANPSMSHAMSAFAGSLFVARWLRLGSDGSSAQWLRLGLIAGLVVLVRVQDAALVLLAVVSLVSSGSLRDATRFSVGLVFAGLVQSGLWFAQHGSGFVAVLTSHSMVAQSSPAIVEFLFSPWHGLLSWTPLFFFALFGLVVLVRSEPRLALSLLLCFLAAVLFNASTGDWWSSESFGQRRMLGLTAVFGLGLGACLSFVTRRPLVASFTLVLGLASWNLQFAYIYNSELAGPRDEAIPLDRLAVAQVDVAYRRLLRASDWMPASVWVPLYDGLKGVWLFHGSKSFRGRVDLGREPKDYYPLVGEGWFPPESSGDRRFRASRSRRSWLSVMLYDTAAPPTRVVVDLRQATPGVAVSVRLDVNGHSVGERAAPTNWGEVLFEVDPRLWRRGPNELTLVYSTTPRLSIPGFRGRNSSVTIDSVRFDH